jgi:hypothetical protein
MTRTAIILQKRIAKPKLPSTISAPARQMLQTMTLIEGEDGRAYQALAAAIISDLEPSDIIECMFVRDVIRYQWDIMQRWRLIEAHLLQTKERKEQEIKGISEERIKENIAALQEALDRDAPGWRERRQPPDEPAASLSPAQPEPSAGSALKDAFKTHGLELERIGRTIFAAENRRNGALNQLETYREATRQLQG